MKIAIVTETFLPSTDGIVTRLTKAIDYFIREGHEVLVIAPDLVYTIYKGAKVIGINRSLSFLLDTVNGGFLLVKCTMN
ncbi:hypothetical protein ACFPFV_12955 [Salinicoccus siamensis]|uniref:hypothetical protein n=1 Tax=Salinicoccus siamensis TaxID=381830 RepID=UPI0036146CB3